MNTMFPGDLGNLCSYTGPQFSCYAKQTVQDENKIGEPPQY